MKNRFPNQRFARKQNKEVSINPLLYVRKAIQEEVASYTPTHSFDDFIISSQLKENIAQKGYTSPTPIQDQAIKPILEGRDVIGLANTGTGKTAAFLVPLINKIIYNRSQKALIIVPTRELAQQIADECTVFMKNTKLFGVLLIGGVSMQNQIQNLRRDPHIVVATPGRLKDLAKKGHMHLSEYNNIVLDEVDRMMDMGFINDVKFIIAQLPKKRQSLFFSATMPSQIAGLAQSFLVSPLTVSVKSQDTAKSVEQDIIRLAGRPKIDVLAELLTQPGFEKVIVFGRTKWGMEKLLRLLTQRGFRVAAIHGNKNQNQRQRALDMFKKNEIQALLATDVASRGLDIDDVTHVINFDEPASYDDYVHRIGRTGRADKTGVALTFIS